MALLPLVPSELIDRVVGEQATVRLGNVTPSVYCVYEPRDDVSVIGLNLFVREFLDSPQRSWPASRPMPPGPAPSPHQGCPQGQRPPEQHVNGDDNWWGPTWDSCGGPPQPEADSAGPSGHRPRHRAGPPTTHLMGSLVAPLGVCLAPVQIGYRGTDGAVIGTAAEAIIAGRDTTANAIVCEGLLPS